MGRGEGMKGGYVIEKCRLCGKVIDSTTHVPNIYAYLRFVTKGTPAPDDGGLPAYSMSCHACEDGSLGVTDVVGFKPDKEEVGA